MKKNIDTWFTIIIIVILIIGIFYIGAELRRLSREGVACLSSPFVYGAKKIIEDNEIDDIDCYCTITGEKGFQSYSFDEKGVIPPTE